MPKNPKPSPVPSEPGCAPATCSALRWHRLCSLTDDTGIFELLAATCIDGVGVIVRWTRTAQGWDIEAMDTERCEWIKVSPDDEDIPQLPPEIFDDAQPNTKEVPNG